MKLKNQTEHYVSLPSGLLFLFQSLALSLLVVSALFTYNSRSTQIQVRSSIAAPMYIQSPKFGKDSNSSKTARKAWSAESTRFKENNLEEVGGFGRRNRTNPS